MEPKFEFVGTTNSALYNVKNQTKNNRIFHIKKTYPDGRETYCEYTTNRVNVNSICLRCTNRKCKGTLILETSQPTHVARTYAQQIRGFIFQNFYRTSENQQVL